MNFSLKSKRKFLFLLNLDNLFFLIFILKVNKFGKAELSLSIVCYLKFFY